MGRKKKALIEEKPLEFCIMNKDAKFFCGLYGGEVMWSEDLKEAKTFTEPSKIKMIERYHPQENSQIVYL